MSRCSTLITRTSGAAGAVAGAFAQPATRAIAAADPNATKAHPFRFKECIRNPIVDTVIKFKRGCRKSGEPPMSGGLGAYQLKGSGSGKAGRALLDL
jgi:hypothetical protein